MFTSASAQSAMMLNLDPPRTVPTFRVLPSTCGRGGAAPGRSEIQLEH